jgi:hypothetical protein
MLAAYSYKLKARSTHVSIDSVAASAFVLFALVLSIGLSFVAYTGVAMRTSQHRQDWANETCRTNSNMRPVVQNPIRSAACRLANEKLRSDVQPAGAFLPVSIR